MEEQEKIQKKYEFAFLLPVGGTQDALKKLLEKSGFEITKEGPVREIKLAYEIKKQAVAQFGYYLLKTEDNESAQKAEKDLNLETSVLRFMFMTFVEPKQKKKEIKADSVDARTDRKEDIIPKVDRIDHLSNEKLEETLEEILK